MGHMYQLVCGVPCLKAADPSQPHARHTDISISPFTLSCLLVIAFAHSIQQKGVPCMAAAEKNGRPAAGSKAMCAPPFVSPLSMPSTAWCADAQGDVAGQTCLSLHQ